jgi:hypothetical protein
MGSLSATNVLDRLAALGCAVRVEGEKLKVRGPNLPEVAVLVSELRAHREEAIPIVRKLSSAPPAPKAGQPGLLSGFDQLGDIDLALSVVTHLEALPSHISATACEIAEALHGRDYTLDQVIQAYRLCEELREARILIRGRDGYGYQSA